MEAKNALEQEKKLKAEYTAVKKVESESKVLTHQSKPSITSPESTSKPSITSPESTSKPSFTSPEFT
jgi:hypothetical protein